MVLLVNALQPIQCHVGVNLRGRDVGVAKQSLDSSQIGAILDHVRGAAMAQHMRTGVTPSLLGCNPNHLPHSLTRNPFCAARNE